MPDRLTRPAAALLFAAALLLAACSSPAPAAPTTPAAIALPQGTYGEPYLFEKSACKYGDLPVDVVCGDLITLKDHNNPDSGPLRIAVTILKATGANPRPDPVLFLSGGPGASATEDLRGWLEHPFLESHDLILVDQRGTGASRPSLDCPEMSSGRYPTDLEAARACHDRLAADGLDLSLFNSAQSAADLNNLRQALGYKEWNVFGVSYGTRLALTLLRDYPQGIRSLILDSVYPPEVDAYEEQPTNGARAVQMVFRACARDRDCAFIYPDLRMVYTQLLYDLDQKPVQVQLQNPATGLTETITLDGYRLASLVFDALYRRETLERIPYVIYEINYKDYAAIADLIYGPPVPAALPGQTTPAPVNSDTSQANSEGLFYSVECREEIPFNDPQTARTAAEGANFPSAIYLYEDVSTLFTICSFWGAGKADDIEDKPVKGSLPVLVLAGQFDPVTPPNWNRIVLRDLPNAYLITFPAAGHAVMDSGKCARQVIADFLADPTQKPDSSCAGETQPHFYVPR